MPIRTSIIDVFNQHFDMVPADSDELKKEVYKLRYHVYCIENGFEDPEHYPDRMEFDDFDSHSVHSLIYHRKRGVYIATTRLILPDANNPDKLFPIEINSKIDNFEALKHISRNYLAEASRFCVSKTFRRERRKQPRSATGIHTELEGIFVQDEKRLFSHISLALFACLIKMSHENNIQDWYAFMEPTLMRFFSTLGINFIGVGSLTNYHGKRRPYTINVNDLLESVANKDINKWDMLTNKGKFWG